MLTMDKNNDVSNEDNISLSICIATYNTGEFIAETLECILNQIQVGVEIVVVDGASSDNTSALMGEYVAHHPQVRYFQEKINSGVDADFDKAVGYARGNYCWLMSDDDLLHDGAIERVLLSLNSLCDLVVVDAEVRNFDMSHLLEKSRLNMDGDKTYIKGDENAFFVDVANHLSFIGCVIIKRAVWMERVRKLYYGTLFIHVGVIFQAPALSKIHVISDPLVIIRFGNAMWTSRAFDIWIRKWPQLIWGFSNYPRQAKELVCSTGMKSVIKSVFQYRAKGVYSLVEFRGYFADSKDNLLKVILYGIAILPVRFVNMISVIYVLKNESSKFSIYDLSLSPNASRLSRWLSRDLSR